jgi:hypothetical protein
MDSPEKIPGVGLFTYERDAEDKQPAPRQA